MNKYNVSLRFTVYTSVEVYAENENEAHEIAELTEYPTDIFDWEDCEVDVYNKTECAKDEPYNIDNIIDWLKMIRPKQFDLKNTIINDFYHVDLYTEDGSFFTTDYRSVRLSSIFLKSNDELFVCNILGNVYSFDNVKEDSKADIYNQLKMYFNDTKGNVSCD